jgi:hypothetical protein
MCTKNCLFNEDAGAYAAVTDQRVSFQGQGGENITVLHFGWYGYILYFYTYT